MSARKPVAGVLFLLAATALAFGMGFSLLYGVRWWMPRPLLDIATMRVTHGLLNSVGFATLAVLAWRQDTAQ